MKIKILKYRTSATPRYQRYTGARKIRGYDDITQLWVLTNVVKCEIEIEYGKQKYRINRVVLPGLITDKASTPGSKSDWYPARYAYLWHDTDFSLHNFKDFEIHDDDGFRFANSMFLSDIDYHIRLAKKTRVIRGFRAILWHIKKRLWYRAVNSIAGQGRYVNADSERGNHKRYTKTKITKIN